MDETNTFREGLQYSDEVINAVRYGYEYRKEAEIHADPKDGYHVQHCLPDPSAILLWLGQKVLDGLVFDVFKDICKRLYQQLTNSEKSIPKLIRSLLTDEQELERFYNYVKEFNECGMAITEKQLSYIKDEIRADYTSKEVSKIFLEEKRLPMHEEYMRIYTEAEAYADKLMRPRE